MNSFRVSLLVETQLDMSSIDVRNRFILIASVLKEEIDKRFVMNGQPQSVKIIPYDVEGYEE